MMNLPRRATLALMLATACGDDRGEGSTDTAGDGESVTTNGEMGASETTDASGTTTGAEPPDPFDLLRCEFAWDCELLRHFYAPEQSIPSECAVRAVHEAAPAVMVLYPFHLAQWSRWEGMMLLLGDGTAIVQEATGYLDFNVDCVGPVPRNVGRQQRCELDLPDDFAGLEEWFPVVKNCEEGEFFTCEGALALLGG